MTWKMSSIGFLVALASLVGCANPDGQNTIAGVQADGQIIGGTDATGNESFSKSTVSLYDVAEGGLCTASILSDSILVTAAHCVGGSPRDLRVIFGKDLNDQSTIIAVRAVETYVVSPVWAIRQGEELNSGDIAIVKFRGGLAPAFKAAEMLENPKDLHNNQAALLAGYGLSDGVKQTGDGVLRFVATKILDAQISKSEVMLEQSKGKGACHGDSGGPAYVTIKGKLKLFGVTSRGVNDPEDHCNGASLYTSVPFYRQWILRTMASLSKPASPATTKVAAGL